MKAGLRNSSLPPHRMLAQCWNVFLTQAHVTLVDGHWDDALPNTQSKRAHYWAWAWVDTDGEEKGKHMDLSKSRNFSFKCKDAVASHLYIITFLSLLMHQHICGLKRCRFSNICKLFIVLCMYSCVCHVNNFFIYYLKVNHLRTLRVTPRAISCDNTTFVIMR